MSSRAAAAAAAAGMVGGAGTGVGAMMGGILPGTRTWHPSPFVSDDDASASDEPTFYKEEKKNRIKMEIARRRQQIEENACLHEELTRLAKLRETAELGGTATTSGVIPSSMMGGVLGSGIGATGGLTGGASLATASATGVGGAFGGTTVGGVGAAGLGGALPLSSSGVGVGMAGLNAAAVTTNPAALASRLTSGIGGGVTGAATTGLTNHHHLAGLSGGLHAAGVGVGVPSTGLDGHASSIAAAATTSNSILKSVDEILRDVPPSTSTAAFDPLAMTATSSAVPAALANSYRPGTSGRAINSLNNPTSALLDGHIPGMGLANNSTAAAGLTNHLNPDLFTAYERTTDFSPMNSELSEYTTAYRPSTARVPSTLLNSTVAMAPSSTVGVGVTSAAVDGDPYGKYSKLLSTTAAPAAAAFK